MSKRISSWQTLFRYFPSSMIDAEHAVVCVRMVRGIKLPSGDRLQVRAEIAKLISTLEQKKQAHSQAVAARSSRRRTATMASASAPDEDSLAKLAADLSTSMFSGSSTQEPVTDADHFGVEGLLDVLLDSPDDPGPTVLHGLPENIGSVAPHQINLIDISDGQVQVEVYPLTFRCPSCGHFQLADPMKVPPRCPCCSTCDDCDKIFTAVKGGRCPHCGSSNGRSTQLRQLSLIEICSRCALVQPIFPYGLHRRPEDWLGRPIRCPKCNIGHVHLRRGLSLADTHFICTRGCHYETWEKELGGRCPECSISGDVSEPNDKGDVAYMKPSPAVASSNLAPLISSFLFLGNEEANLLSLKAGFVRQRTGGDGGWDLEQLGANIPIPDKADMMQKLCVIQDAFTLSGIRTTTVNYGYWSRAQEHKRPIKDEDRLHRFYRNDPNYDAYFVETEGHGLVIAFDKDRLLTVVNEATGAAFQSYDELVENGLFQLRGDNPAGQIVFQELIDPEKVAQHPNLALLRLLHSLEHALLTQAEEQIGLQIFGSKLLIRDATVVLYEQEDVGDGGVQQLVVGNGFLKLIRAIHNQLGICEQDCETGCPACNYIEDSKCRPFVPHEFQDVGVRWVPSNALLGRDLAHRYLDSCVNKWQQ